MSIELLMIIGIVFIALLVGIVLLAPGEGKKKKGKKKIIKETEPAVDTSHFEQKISRLEKHINALRVDISNAQREEKSIQKELMVEKVKVKKVQEKLSQEREWHKKEKTGIDKKSHELVELKNELKNVQESFSKAHAGNLRNEHKIKECEDEIKKINNKRREVEEMNSQLNAQHDVYRREIVQLNKENKQLAKKKNDVQWVAKSEFERVSNLLHEKEKELKQLKRESD